MYGIYYSLRQSSLVSLWADIQKLEAVGPGAEYQFTYLVINREIRNVNLARARQDCGI